MTQRTGSFFAARGIREKVLRTVGAGQLYDRLAALTSSLHQQSMVSARLQEEKETLQEAKETLQVDLQNERRALHSAVSRVAHFDRMAAEHRMIQLDYPARPRVRGGWGKPTEPRMTELIANGNAHYSERIASFLPLVDKMAEIPSKTYTPNEAHWVNDWIPAFDAVSIYAQLVHRNPKTFFEIGSGTSTKFARRAIKDFGLRTRIISIDPFPRSEIDAICDEIIRVPLQEVSASAFNGLTEEDMLFFDGSHRALPDSDVTVFFTEILPSLPGGLLTGIHDIFLPADYPEFWGERFYSEQYMLACWLLASDTLKIELPVFHCATEPELHRILNPLWGKPNLIGAYNHGGAFWFTT